MRTKYVNTFVSLAFATASAWLASSDTTGSTRDETFGNRECMESHPGKNPHVNYVSWVFAWMAFEFSNQEKENSRTGRDSGIVLPHPGVKLRHFKMKPVVLYC